MFSPLLITHQGIFSCKENDWFIETSTKTESLNSILSPFVGETVEVCCHHFPSNPVNPAVAGGGSCLWGAGNCPHGHSDNNMGWWYKVQLEGRLTQSQGNWEIGGEKLLLGPMEGHIGRLVIFGSPVKTTDSVQSIREPLQQLAELSNLLSELKGLL